ncbi:MAG TPA: protein kinase [Methylomirabilota bacterium]|jgi:hypothetical protein
MVKRIGKYQIVARIGRGAMGDVYKAHDPILDRLVALKVISGEIEVTDDLRARFFREAQAGAKLSHPNIVTVHDLAEEDGQLFIVMEFLEGEELRQVIGQRRNLGLENKLSLMLQACDGLGYAHARGIIHRDIKPGNIFVLSTGRVKLLDFGIARLATGDPDLTRTGFVMGTLRYMSPEQSRGRVDKRSDIFSLGAVFYELLTYKPAFPGDDPMEIMEAVRLLEPAPLTSVDPSLPADLGEVIAHALRKDPAQRYPDLGEMRQALAQVQFRVVNEAESARRRLETRIEELRELERTLSRQGRAVTTGAMPAVSSDADIRAIVQTEREVSARLERLRAEAAQSARLDRAVDRAWTLLADGDAEAALRAFERVLGEVPDHTRALEGAREARLAVERAREVAPTTVYAADRLEPGEMTTVTQVLESPAHLETPRDRRRGRLPLTVAAIVVLVVGVGLAAMYGPWSPWRPAQGTGQTVAEMVGALETTTPAASVPATSPAPANAAAPTREQPAASPPAAEPKAETPVVPKGPVELPARDARPARDADQTKVAKLPPSNAPVAAAPPPSAPAPVAPAPTVPAASSPRRALTPLASDAGLDQTIAWLAAAVRDHARTGYTARHVGYRVVRLDACNVEFEAMGESGGGFRVKAALPNVDRTKIRSTRGDNGWKVDLPWADGESRTVGDDVFNGVAVWFEERDADKASAVAAGFQRAVTLCAQ